jgi:hypothetical protein
MAASVQQDSVRGGIVAAAANAVVFCEVGGQREKVQKCVRT